MLPYLSAVRPWVSHVTFRSLSFLTRKMGAINLYLAGVLEDSVCESEGYAVKHL